LQHEDFTQVIVQTRAGASDKVNYPLSEPKLVIGQNVDLSIVVLDFLGDLSVFGTYGSRSVAKGVSNIFRSLLLNLLLQICVGWS